MKKIFFALAALVLAFIGCSQEEDAIQVSEKKAVKVVVNMDKPGFGDDTRAARTGWVEGDEVVIMLDDDLEHLILLRYNGTSWEEMVTYLDIDIFRPMGSAQNDYLADLTNGTLKAIYCSSGIYGAKPFPEEYVDVEDLEGIDIISYARNNEDYDEDLGDYSPNPLGECIMTCENGTYSASSGVLTLNITMVPRVAQFTIKNLSDDEEGKTSEGLEVGVAGGNLFAYAGAFIMPGEGIILGQVYLAGRYNACWVHPNADGISIYASTYGSNNFANDETYIFSVGDYVREFNCNEYKSRIYNGAAIIMDGPYTDGAASKWGEPE